MRVQINYCQDHGRNPGETSSNSLLKTKTKKTKNKKELQFEFG
jgi:hypothetical protein